MDEPCSYMIAVRRIRTHFLQSGSGPAVILLHGWAQSSATWKNVVPELERHYTVYAIDLPGFGESDIPPEIWNTSDYARFLHDWVSQLGIEPYAIIGHSFGARVAAQYASAHPPQKLVLYGMGIPSLFRTLNTILARVLKDIAPKMLFAAHRTSLTPRGFADISPLSTECARRMLEIYVATHGAETVPSITSNTLLIYGKRDPITPPWIGSRLRSVIRNSALEIIPNAGHFVHVRQPHEFVRIVREFLER